MDRNIYVSIHIYICICIHKYVQLYRNFHVYVHTYIHINHTHTHTDPLHAKLELLKDIANVVPGLGSQPRWNFKLDIFARAQDMAQQVLTTKDYIFVQFMGSRFQV